MSSCEASPPASIEVTVELNGREVVRRRGSSMSGIAAMVARPVPEAWHEQEVLDEADRKHFAEYAGALGRQPAPPSEQMKGGRLLVLQLDVGDSGVLIGFREGDTVVVVVNDLRAWAENEPPQ